VDGRHVDLARVGEGGDLARVAGLEPEVELLAQPVGELAGQLGHVVVGAPGGARLGHPGQLGQDQQVAVDRLGDTGPLHFDHHRLAPAQPAPVGLGDRGGGERLGVEGGEHLGGRLAQPEQGAEAVPDRDPGDLGVAGEAAAGAADRPQRAGDRHQPAPGPGQSARLGQQLHPDRGRHGEHGREHPQVAGEPARRCRRRRSPATGPARPAIRPRRRAAWPPMTATPRAAGRPARRSPGSPAARAPGSSRAARPSAPP
jgi:hypothetical protein